MKKIRFLLIFSLLFVTIISNAQNKIENYVFEQVSGTFTSISSTGTDVLISSGYDDHGYDIDLSAQGFSFNFCGQSYSSFSINTNGGIQLGGTAFDSRFNNLADTSYFPILMPVWDDLTFFDNTAGHGLYYQIDGTGDQQILTIEWNNVAEYHHKYDNCIITFQLKLYEATGVVEFVYGDVSNIDNWDIDCTASIGINNNENGTMAFQSITPGTPATSSTTVSNNNVTDTQIASIPEGTIYRFTYVEPPLYTVTFAVTDGTNPLENVIININGTDLTTNASGIATIDLVDGVYDYTAALAGYDTVAGSVTVAGDTERVDIVMNKTEYAVVFAVTDGTNPLENVIININGIDLTTNASGIATIDLVDGTYDYTATLAGYDTVTGSITVAGDTERVDIVMNESEYTTTFTVTDGANPLENVNININGTDITTDTNGQATITLPNGVYTYTATLDGYETVSGLDTIYNADNNINIVMVKNEFTTTFTVTDGANPLENVNININGTDITTDTNGQATITLPNGVYTYTATLDGYETVSGLDTIYNADNNINIVMNILDKIFERADKVSIYPNPSNGIFFIQITDFQDFNVQVIDVSGKIVGNYQNISSSNRIDISNSPSGVYFVKINVGNQIFTQKIIKK